MKAVKQKSLFIILPLALLGFAVAQPIYQLLLQTPQFLLSRQNTGMDILFLAGALSLVLPVLLGMVCWLLDKKWPALAAGFLFLISSTLCALFVAQLTQDSLGASFYLYTLIAATSGVLVSWVLIKTRWSDLLWPLAIISLIFPAWFLLVSPVFKQLDEFATVSLKGPDQEQALPNIIFVLFDELPLVTLLDDEMNIDADLFPGFSRLQGMSDWYFNTTSVSDGTADAVPAILTGRYSQGDQRELSIATQPVNLFTNLRHHYELNVSESVTRYCPQSECPRSGPSGLSRLKSLLLDLSAIYLHRVAPLAWQIYLPDVTNNWSGFFAQRQVFFPQGWLENAGEQTIIDRPAFFRRFIASIEKSDTPTLNFIHLLFPHGPVAYLPDGRNYGLQWMRGQMNDQWEDLEWAVVSAKQRHYLQTQLADRMTGELIDHLQESNMLDSSVVVVLSDHGFSFKLNDRRRALGEDNAAELLRVPMFIKHPAQITGQRIDEPVMTIDLLPTLLASLGFDSRQIEMDGKDLAGEALGKQRQRYAKSHLGGDNQLLDESSLQLGELVMENRRQLKLDEPDNALWNIGPYDDSRGKPLSSVCGEVIRDINVHLDGPNELPRTLPENRVNLFVSGTFSGNAVNASPMPFIITDQETIVASGTSWTFNGKPLFFALVEPALLDSNDWSPEVWWVENGQCHGQSL
jgi:hypothetical protein